MPKYKRTILNITDLPPKSASSVFLFLDTLFNDKDLDIDFFKTNLKNFNSQEQNYICFYAKVYFNEKEKSYLNSKIIELERDFSLEMAHQQITTLTENAEKLINYIDNVKAKTLSRQSALIKKRKLTSDFNKGVKITSYFERLPLYSTNKEIKYSENTKLVEKFLPKEIIEHKIQLGEDPTIKVKSDYYTTLRDFFFDILCKELDYNYVKSIFYNSFSFEENMLSLQLLDIEFENSHRIYNCFYEIFLKYNELQSELIKDIVKREENVRELTLIRTRLTRKIKQNQATKIDFMNLMYCAFPQIRDSYSTYKTKNPKATLKDYLSTKSRNIR